MTDRSDPTAELAVDWKTPTAIAPMIATTRRRNGDMLFGEDRVDPAEPAGGTAQGTIVRSGVARVVAVVATKVCPPILATTADIVPRKAVRCRRCIRWLSPCHSGKEKCVSIRIYAFVSGRSRRVYKRIGRREERTGEAGGAGLGRGEGTVGSGPLPRRANVGRGDRAGGLSWAPTEGPRFLR